MNLWLQTRRYFCHRCGAVYVHDQAHAHAVYVCPMRPKREQPKR